MIGDTMQEKISIGNVEVLSVVDMFPPGRATSFFFPDVPENAWDPYREEQLSPAGEIVLPYCLFVLRSQGQIILADTGMGAGPHLSRGNLTGNVLNELQNIIDSMWTIYGRGLGLDPSPEREYHDMGSQTDSDQGRAFGHDSIDNQKWMDFDYLHENDLMIVGSPETVARKLKSTAEKGLFNVFCGEFNVGSLPEDNLMRSIRLFGTKVIPALREFDPVEDTLRHPT